MQPRHIPDGAIVMVTRRCLRRSKLLRPDAMMTQIYCYLLAWAAKKHGVRVVAATVMSTHEHLIIQAPESSIVASFMRDLHRMVALCGKIYRKWEGAFWDHEAPSVVVLKTPEALVEKLAYIMANPVSAHLVSHANMWPGLNCLPSQLGTTLPAVERPPHFLSAESGRWPDSLALELSMPDAFGLTLETLRELVFAELKLCQADAHRELKREGQEWLGAKAVLRTSPYSRATSFEALVDRNPTFAVGRNQRAAFFEAVTALRAFRRAYRAAWLTWRRGIRDVVFPAYTQAMRAVHGVQVALG